MVVSQSLIYTPQCALGVGKVTSSGLNKQASNEKSEVQMKNDQTQPVYSIKKLPPQVPVDKDAQPKQNVSNSKVGIQGGCAPQINQTKKKVLEAATKKFQREKLGPYVPNNKSKNKAPLPTG